MGTDDIDGAATTTDVLRAVDLGTAQIDADFEALWPLIGSWNLILEGVRDSLPARWTEGTQRVS